MSVSFKVMKTSERDDSVMYRAECACCDPDDDLYLEVEAHEEGDVYLLFSGDYSASAYDDRWYVGVCKRIKSALVLLFTGKLKSYKEFVILGRGHIEGFIGALEEAKGKFEEPKA